MLAISRDQQLEMIAYATKQLEMPEILLVENAAAKVISAIDLSRRETFAIFCGTEFNGACGLAIARGLLTKGKKVQIFIVGDLQEPSPAFEVNHQILFHMKAKMKRIKTLGDIEDLLQELMKVNTIIDAIYGTEKSTPVDSIASIAIGQINESRIFTLSIDIASGIDATSGRPLGDFVEPGVMVTFEFMKKGMEACPYLHCPVTILPLGLPREAKSYVLGKDWESKMEKEEKNVKY